MSGFTKAMQDSMALDAAFLKRGVPALIDSMAVLALKEVEDARDNDPGDSRGEDDEAVLRRGLS